MIFPRVFDATTSREDFERLLPRATGTTDISRNGDAYIGVGWQIQCRCIEPLSIGLVHLQRHRIEINFSELSDADQEAFMRRFSQHYQRGGG